MSVLAGACLKDSQLKRVRTDTSQVSVLAGACLKDSQLKRVRTDTSQVSSRESTKTSKDRHLSGVRFSRCLSSREPVERVRTDTSLKRTPRVGPCLSLLFLFDSL